MGKTSKATKKFNKKHLKHTLEQRKKSQDYKKKIGARGTKRSSNKGSSNGSMAKNGEIFKDLDVEKYFEKGIEPPKEKHEKKQAKKEEQDEDDDEDAESSDSDAEMDQKDLDDLEKEDPEFYKYLQDNDKALLDFQPMNPLDAIDDDDDDDEEEDEEADAGKEKITNIEAPVVDVTIEMVKEWESNLKSSQPNIKGMKHVVIAFKSAVNIETDRQYRYRVTSEKVFNLLMVLVLKQLPLAIEKLTPYKISAKGARSLPSGNKKKTAQISSILKIHAGSLIELLDGITNTETAALILQSIQELLPYFMSWRKILKQFVNSAVGIWSTAKQFDTQVAAFAFLNNASKEYPKSVLELVLRSTYSNFIKNCSRTNIHTMPGLNFQKNSMAGLFVEDENLGYQVGFESVRQLAIHLRNGVNNPTKESYKSVYNWQFCHALDFWSRTLAAKNQEDGPLKQLIYPLVQVTIGTIRLVPSAQFFPLRFYLIRSLIRLSQTTGVFIPLFPLLSETLTSTAFNGRPKSSSLAAVDFEDSIKVNKAYLGTRVYQQGLCEQFIELTSEFFVLYCKSIAFPELATPATIYLRRYRKKSTNAKFNKMLGALIDKLNANSKFIEQKRSNVEYGPSNKQEVAKFLQEVKWESTPLGGYVRTQREVKEARMKVLRESIEESERAEKEKEEREKEEEREDDDVDMEGDDGEEDDGEEDDGEDDDGEEDGEDDGEDEE
ncbi:DEKNAAC102479 [Brettanomyces naardenensis]|uniref:DEKNAAC102479 n=1 Tax=Brettanomyces naardenensis TaxID=13370 RepID=A0A448YLN2_BRENA|nr:DEKNAAC102479 [Brettanomyces naardenensis]